MRIVASGIKNCVISIFFILSFFVFNAGTANASEEVYYIHTDHLGSTSVITANGTKISESKYYPYGTIRAENTAQSAKVTEKGYTGQISDKTETGLLYYNARYYDPSTAKFTQPDRLKDRLNLYAYVYNNPINLTDPSGLRTEDRDPLAFNQLEYEETRYYNNLFSKIDSMIKQYKGWGKLKLEEKIDYIEMVIMPEVAPYSSKYLEAVNSEDAKKIEDFWAAHGDLSTEDVLYELVVEDLLVCADISAMESVIVQKYLPDVGVYVLDVGQPFQGDGHTLNIYKIKNKYYISDPSINSGLVKLNNDFIEETYNRGFYNWGDTVTIMTPLSSSGIEDLIDYMAQFGLLLAESDVY